MKIETLTESKKEAVEKWREYVAAEKIHHASVFGDAGRSGDQDYVPERSLYRAQQEQFSKTSALL